MAVTALNANAEPLQVTIARDPVTEVFSIVIGGLVWKGRVKRRVSVETTTSDPEMVGAEPTLNDLIADINDAAIAFNA